MRLIKRAPAKLNLFLAVEPDIVDGKHLLTSVFTTISLYDTLSFDFVEETSIAPNGLSYGAVTLKVVAEQDAAISRLTADDNMVMKAAHAFLAVYGALIPAKGLHITLEKHIPAQAGLGGGSSDAATTLACLAKVAGIDRLDPKLIDIARKLGADVPFFLYGACALMRGFGDVFIKSIPLGELHFALVKPAEGISTKEVYRLYDERGAGVPLVDPLVDASARKAVLHELGATMANNLEALAHLVLPKLTVIKRQLAEQPGVVRVMLTGSGSTLFALCKDASSARTVAQEFSKRGYWACSVTTYTC